jgi:hypothetical protein
VIGPKTLAEKSQRINLGLALLSVLNSNCNPLTSQDIAAWCGCTTQAISAIERRALRKIWVHLKFRNRALCAELAAAEREFGRDVGEAPVPFAPGGK